MQDYNIDIIRRKYQMVPRTLVFIEKDEKILTLCKQKRDSFGFGKLNGIGGHINRGDSPGLSIYVQVRDVSASLARSLELGATKVHDPVQIPGGPMIAGITDPEGNSLVLVQQ